VGHGHRRAAGVRVIVSCGRLRLPVLALLVLSSCRRDAAVTKPHDREVRHAEADVGAPPRVRLLGDIAEHHGKRVIVEAKYEVEPIARGKGGKRVWLVLIDGTRISRAYDVVASELPYTGHLVLATGVITSGPPDTHIQALNAPHLALEKLELRSNQPPIDNTLTDVPAPPIGSTTPSLARAIDDWVQVVATLSAISATDTATLKLSDGGVVRVERVQAASWTPLIGRTVTVTGRLAMEGGFPGAFALDLVIRGPTAICAGVVARCGM